MISPPLPGNPKGPGTITAIGIFLAGIAFSGLVYFTVSYFSEKQPENLSTDDQAYTIRRVNGFKNIQPILSVEPNEESASFSPLKSELNDIIEQLRANGAISEASVYLREFDHGKWAYLNPDGQYHPASLMKVALLICYLRMAETNPGLLDKELYFEQPEPGKITTQYYSGKSIEAGKKYKIHELLYYMIAYSDNNATWVLSSHFNPEMLYKLFSDLGLKPPVQDELAFKMTAKEYATFFNAIYNSSYLTPEYSDYAAELLQQCSFGEGFVKGIGKNQDSTIWHKFGEWRHPGHDYELHESGIIHVKGKPYLLTIMTRGNNTDHLADGISRISQKVYEVLGTP